ncbi:MAG TPA: ISKra4 family transposase [Roseiflexaceae bacterium]|nr:ISKra4 family transposase [Roseiflexaceae bacterium]
MASARNAKRVFSPLDEELGLLPGQLTPLLQEHLAHLGTWMPFAHAAQLLSRFFQVSVSESSAQRLTEAIGIAYEAVQVAEVERIERDWPEVEHGPDKLLLSLDGAFVPLLHGEWAEAKTLVIGEVSEPRMLDGKTVVSAHSLSYFSRIAEAEQFQRLTFGELYRRQIETAEHVASVSDGAEWIQGFIDFHTPSATRILDFPHAAQRICQIGEAVLGAEHASLAAWRTRQLHQLKHDGPQAVLESLRLFAAAHLNVPLVAENLAYLEKRVAQMQYPTFQAAGWPIGSGMVESANKVVVEARLKGAGMHWSRASVNPLLTLRNAVCNDRWAEAWQQSAAHVRRVGMCRREVQPKSEAAVEGAQATPVASTAVQVSMTTAPSEPRKPPDEHPWRRRNNATKAAIAQAKC